MQQKWRDGKVLYSVLFVVPVCAWVWWVRGAPTVSGGRLWPCTGPTATRRPGQRFRLKHESEYCSWRFRRSRRPYVHRSPFPVRGRSHASVRKPPIRNTALPPRPDGRGVCTFAYIALAPSDDAVRLFGSAGGSSLWPLDRGTRAVTSTGAGRPGG
eukprot:4230044-Prymnesium_polylepis.1